MPRLGMPTSDHSTYSSLREKLVEHLVLGEILKTAWIAGLRDIEVLKPEVVAALFGAGH